MKCSDFLKELTDYLDNTMDPHTKAELEEHLQWCHNCYVVCNTTKSTIEIYRGLRTLRTSRRSSHPHPLPPSFQSANATRCSAEAATPATQSSGHRKKSLPSSSSTGYTEAVSIHEEKARLTGPFFVLRLAAASAWLLAGLAACLLPDAVFRFSGAFFAGFLTRAVLHVLRRDALRRGLLPASPALACELWPPLRADSWLPAWPSQPALPQLSASGFAGAFTALAAGLEDAAFFRGDGLRGSDLGRLGGFFSAAEACAGSRGLLSPPPWNSRQERLPRRLLAASAANAIACGLPPWRPAVRAFLAAARPRRTGVGGGGGGGGSKGARNFMISLSERSFPSSSSRNASWQIREYSGSWGVMRNSAICVIGNFS